MRFTEKDKKGNYYTTGENIKKTYPKLGQLEDIEDELGIDLITLFKALNDQIYIKENYDGTIVDKTLWCSNCIICGLGEPIIKVADYGVYPKDYGKTWALTKEELLWLKD